MTITPATPAINTSQQPATAIVGTSIADKATVSGGFNPTGTVTFNLYNNSTATGTPLFTDTETLSGGVATSAGYTATATGTDYWVATYNGDSNNVAVTSGTALEPVSVTPATPAINTSQQPAIAIVGTSIADTGHGQRRLQPDRHRHLQPLQQRDGQRHAAVHRHRDRSSGGVATSAGYTATATGTDYWVATYNGDSNNIAVTSGTALEPVSVTPATPAINTSQQPASAIVGTSIADKATVSGGYNPTGTVTFNLYSNATASGTPLFTRHRDRSRAAWPPRRATPPPPPAPTTGSPPTTATATTVAVTSGTALEPVSITPATPAINTSQQPATAIVGTSIADKATVSGGYNPTGTVTFNLYSNATASGTPLFTRHRDAARAARPTSAGYTATATGTDYWVATYNGDSNNVAVTSGTALEPVTSPRPARRSTPASSRPSAIVGTSIADTGHGQRRLQPDRHRHLQPLQQLDRPAARRCSPTPRPLVGRQWPPRRATRPRPPAPTTGSPPTTATRNNSAVTSGTAAEPVTHHPGHAGDQHQPAAGHGRRRHLDRRQGHGQRRYSPTGTVTFNLYTTRRRRGTPLFTDTETARQAARPTSAGYTATATGTDYWVATYNGDSNNVAVTSGTAWSR